MRAPTEQFALVRLCTWAAVSCGQARFSSTGRGSAHRLPRSLAPVAHEIVLPARATSLLAKEQAENAREAAERTSEGRVAEGTLRPFRYPTVGHGARQDCHATWY